MSHPVLMRTSFDNPEQFDATSWFSNGTYKRTQLKMNGKVFEHETAMVRTQPMPLVPSQNPELCAGAAVAIERSVSGFDASSLIKDCPDLLRRTSYVISGFGAPNKPEDHYRIYITLQGRRFIVEMVRDGVSGKILHVTDALDVTTLDTDDVAIFQRFEAAEHPAQKP